MAAHKRFSSILLTVFLASFAIAQSTKPVQSSTPAKSATKASAPLKATAAKTTAPSSQFPKLEFEKYKLPNGLEVIVHEDHRLPLVAVNLWYHVGPANEGPGRTGFAHLFQHMMFGGS